MARWPHWKKPVGTPAERGPRKTIKEYAEPRRSVRHDLQTELSNKAMCINVENPGYNQDALRE